MGLLLGVLLLAALLAILAALVLAVGLGVAALLSIIAAVPLADVLVAASIFTAVIVHCFIKFVSMLRMSEYDHERVADDDIVVSPTFPRAWLYPRHRRVRRPKRPPQG